MRIILVCGARPNFVKVASLMRAFRATPGFQPVLVHTGQHYDDRMSRSFFEDLEIPSPQINLEVGTGSHAMQTAAIMQRFEPVVLEHDADAVLVVGDVNSTMACALVAAKLNVPVIHVEAGLRSFDRRMPEEVNRVVTDAISDILFVSEPAGEDNLRREGIPSNRVHFVGNVMIDTLLHFRERAAATGILDDLGLAPRDYLVVTLHRPGNVDDTSIANEFVDVLEEIQKERRVVFPMHPRTRSRFDAMGLNKRLDAMDRLTRLEPLGYLDFLRLIADAAVVLTDSGGIQEETTILGVPCLTARENTERPITLTSGTNQLVGTEPGAILAGYRKACLRDTKTHPVPEKWDGKASRRIVEVLADGALATR